MTVFGVMADIHANIHALEAVLAVLRRAGVNGYVCAGDLVGYGAFPNECVERVAGLGAACVAGNHDLIAIDRLSGEGSGALAARSLEWTRGRLRADTREYLSGLPSRVVLEGGGMVAHGSFDDPRSYIHAGPDARRQLKRLEGQLPAARVLVLGHTHRAMAYARFGGARRIHPGRPISIARDGPDLLNPGSVGQSRERALRASCMVLDLERLEATFHVVPYDVESARAALLSEGLDGRSLQLVPSTPRRLVASLRARC